jgi:hypothetical protein
MPRERIVDPEQFEEKTRKPERVRKPMIKLAACPAPESVMEGWRVRFFLGEDEHLYERRRRSKNGLRVERWYVISQFEARRLPPSERFERARAWRENPAPEEKPSRQQERLKRRRYDELMCHYAVATLLSDLIDEIDYAIETDLFDDERQRLLRKMQRRLVDLKILGYELGERKLEPAPPRSPTIRKRSSIKIPIALATTSIH